MHGGTSCRDVAWAQQMHAAVHTNYYFRQLHLDQCQAILHAAMNSSHTSRRQTPAAHLQLLVA
jgi:hypothetical protein